MQDLNDKVTGNSLTAPEWNEVPSEIQNVIEDTGQTLSSGDLNQLGKGVAMYAANGVFYTDSGAANAYVLTAIGGKQTPPAYADGMTVRFIPGNDNTGAATVNVAGLGVKSIKAGGADIPAGYLNTSSIATLIYDNANGWFEWQRQGEAINPLLVDYTVPSDTTSVNFTGLDSVTHGGYLIEILHLNTTGSTSQIETFVNGDTTSTNYYNQLSRSSGATHADAQSNNAAIMAASTSNQCVANMVLHHEANRRPRFIVNSARDGTTNLQREDRAQWYTNTLANVTQITFTASVALSIGAGSRFRIWRRDV